MFPLTSNEAYIKPNGERSTLGAELGGSSYTLPTAGANTKGGVKIGTGLKMTGEVLSADQVPAHTIAEAGKVLTVADDGSLEWDNKGSGGGDAFISYDFTKMGNRTLNNVTFSENGASFSGTNNIVQICNFIQATTDFTVYIDIGNFEIVPAANTHRRFIIAPSSGAAERGLIWRYNSSAWSFYAGSWEDSNITDPAFFSNSTLKIYIDGSSKWHIYKNNVLVFEPTSAQAVFSLYIGSDAQSITAGIFKNARLYNGNYTE